MSDDTKALKLTVGEILRSALQGTSPRYCAGHFTRWGHVEADINAAIDADRDALSERCEKLREALRDATQIVEQYVSRNPTWTNGIGKTQDPMGAHALLSKMLALAAPKDAP